MDREISALLILSADGEIAPVGLRRGVYVAGTTDTGQLVEVTRTGTDGAPWAEMVTDPLITAPMAGQQRGVAELAATGRRRVETLVLPLATSMDD